MTRISVRTRGRPGERGDDRCRTARGAAVGEMEAGHTSARVPELAARRQNTDHGMSNAIDADALANRGRRASECARCQGVTHHRDAVGTYRLIARLDETPGCCVDAERAEET